MHHTIRARRGLAAAAITAALVASLLALAVPADAVTETETRRLAGDNRFATAAAVAADAFPGGADAVVLATGEQFADALAASGLAGAVGAPVLLTASATLTPAAADAIDSLDPDTVFLMGGTVAIAQSVQDALVADGRTVTRISGQNRFETAAAAGAAVDATTADVGSTPEGRTAILANGLNFPDAVSGSPVAFAGRFPILLAETNRIPPATLAALDSLAIDHVLVLGGPAAISTPVEDAIEAAGYTTQRLAGDNRFATNATVNDFAADLLGVGGPTAYLATGAAFPDALAAGPAAGLAGSPLLLTNPTVLPGSTSAYLRTNAAAIDEIVAIGGPSAISDATVAAAAAAARLASNQSIEVSPADQAFPPLSTLFLTSEGARSFTASGLEPGVAYEIALVNAESVVEAGTGVGFNPFALSDDAATSIESVNGTPVGASGLVETQQETATASAEGTITFTIDATEPDDVIPVVFRDLDADGELDLAGILPEEPFGIGGRTTWLPAEAANGAYTGVTVTQIDTAAGYLVADGGQFRFEGTDRYRTAGTARTAQQFKDLITVGDVLSIEYFREAQSQFDVTTDTLPPISDVRATVPNAASPNLVEVSWTPSAQPDAVYTVHRDDGDGVFDAGDAVISPTGATTTRQFVDAAGSAQRYWVVPKGGVANQAGDPVLSNEVQPGLTAFGLTNGTTVATNAGLSALNAGDVLLLHFSRPVTLAPNATLAVTQGATTVTIARGSNSSWAVTDTQLQITLGAAADALPDISYGPGTTVTGITGVSAEGGVAIALGDLRDTVLEDDGPELMAESTTCDPGENTCTVAFNEPVGTSANAVGNYAYVGAPNLTGAARGADNRTITFTFSAGIGANDTIAPVNGANAVSDAGGAASTQAAFDFVR